MIIERIEFCYFIFLCVYMDFFNLHIYTVFRLLFPFFCLYYKMYIMYNVRVRYVSIDCIVSTQQQQQQQQQKCKY